MVKKWKYAEECGKIVMFMFGSSARQKGRFILSQKRRDTKGRILRDNERQRTDGSYEFRYFGSDGKKHSVYSWCLVATDKPPAGKRSKAPLRELEKQVQKDLLDGIYTAGGGLTVIEQVERYVLTKTGVKPTTEAGYKTVLNVLRQTEFGGRRIDSIKLSDAKLFLIDMQKKDGKSFSTIHTVRGVLRPAFQMAVDDDLIRKNPFDWQLASVLVDDSHTREAISRADERKFLSFVEEDPHFCEYYDAIFILLHTGLRISELCGLTLSNVDFQKKEILIDHQLQRKQDGTLYAETTKTESGVRTIPMAKEVYECFQRVVTSRVPPQVEPMVDGYTGFVWLNKKARKGLRPMVAMDWEHIFKRIVTKYNSIYKVQLPTITPHVCRHTFCSNMAKSGMNPKVLQYLMGHSDISITLNTYTHLGLEAAKEELNRLSTQEKAIKRA